MNTNRAIIDRKSARSSTSTQPRRFLRIAGGFTLLFAALLVSPEPHLRAQPVPVPALGTPAYQTTDFDPYFSSAQGSKTQSNWETLVDQARIFLTGQWEAQVDASIDAHVASVGHSDYFNSPAEYQAYLRRELNLQKQTAYAAWETAADAQIEAERNRFIAALTEADKRKAVEDSDAAIDAGQTTTQPVNEEQKKWEQAFAADISKGLFDFQTAMADLDKEYTAFMAEIDNKEQQFEQQRLANEARETVVRNAMRSAVAGMETFLKSNQLFYTEACDGVNKCNYTTEGANLQNLIDQINDGLNNQAPLSTLADTMNTYLQAQATYAANRQAHWGARIRNDNFQPTDHTQVPMYGRTSRFENHWLWKWRPSDIPGYIRGRVGTRTAPAPTNHIIDWAAVNANWQMQAMFSFLHGDHSAAKNYLKQRFLHSEVQITAIHNIDACGTTQGSNGSPWDNWCYRAHDVLAFTYVDTGSHKGKVSTHINSELEYNIHTHFGWYDPNADHNHQVWTGYVNDMTPVVDDWTNNILPAIQNWEAQTATYEADFAAWQAQANTNRAQATSEYQRRLTEMTERRNKWLSQMQEEFRDGRGQWQVLADRERTAAANGGIGTGASGGPLTVTASVAQPDLFREVFLSEQKKKFLEREISVVPDSSLIDGLADKITRTSRGIRQIALAGAMSDYAKQQQEDIINTMVGNLEAVGGVSTGEAENRELKGFNVEVAADGTIRATRQIHTGQAIRTGGNGTSISDYKAELKEQSLQIAPPPVMKLATGGGLFDEEWDMGEVYSDFGESQQNLGKAIQKSYENFGESFTVAQNEMARNMQQFFKDREGQMTEARLAESRKKNGVGGVLQSLATAMFSGGISFQQALQNHMQNQVAAKVAEVTGLPSSIFSSMLGGASMHDSVKEYVKSETDNLITGAIVKATGLPAGFISGMVSGGGVDFSGETMKNAFNNYADELFAEKLEEGTGIPGLAGFLKRTTIADRNAKKAAREAAKPKPEDIASGGATYVWRNADHNENLGVALQAAETVGGAVAVGTGWGTAAFAGYMAAKGAYKGYLAGDSNETILKKAAVAGGSAVINHYTSKVGVSVNLTYDEDGGFGGSVSGSFPVGGADSPFKLGGNLSFQEGKGITGGGVTAGFEFANGVGLNAGANFAYDSKTGQAKSTGGSLSASYNADSGFGGSASVNFNESGNVANVSAELTYKTKKDWKGGDGKNRVGASGTHTAGLGLTINADRSYSVNAINRVSGEDKYGIGVNSANASGSLTVNYDATGAYAGHSSSQSAEFGFQTQDEKEARMAARLAALEKKFIETPELGTQEELDEYNALRKRNDKENREIASKRYIDRLVHQGKLTPEQAEELRKDPKKWHTAEYARKLLASQDSGQSRESVWDRFTGAISDAGKWLIGDYSTADGFLDPESGELVARTCFVAGTLVRVHRETRGAFEQNDSWYKRIEDIRAGDLVSSWNEHTGEIDYRAVTQTFTRETNLVFKIEYENGIQIQSTWNHPFYINGSGWVEVKDLRAGQTSVASATILNGSMLTKTNSNVTRVTTTYNTDAYQIAEISKERRNKKVYNFEVAENHTYFVTTSDILVHNQVYAQAAPDQLRKAALNKILGGGVNATAYAIQRASDLAAITGITKEKQKAYLFTLLELATRPAGDANYGIIDLHSYVESESDEAWEATGCNDGAAASAECALDLVTMGKGTLGKQATKEVTEYVAKKILQKYPGMSKKKAVQMARDYVHVELNIRDRRFQVGIGPKDRKATIGYEDKFYVGVQNGEGLSQQNARLKIDGEGVDYSLRLGQAEGVTRVKKTEEEGWSFSTGFNWFFGKNGGNKAGGEVTVNENGDKTIQGTASGSQAEVAGSVTLSEFGTTYSADAKRKLDMSEEKNAFGFGFTYDTTQKEGERTGIRVEASRERYGTEHTGTFSISDGGKQAQLEINRKKENKKENSSGTATINITQETYEQQYKRFRTDPLYKRCVKARGTLVNGRCMLR